MTQANTQTKNVTLQTPPGTASYCFVIEPRKNEQSGKMEYSTALLIPKSRAAELEPMKKAIMEVAVAKFGPTAAERFKNKTLRYPIRDGDVERPDDKNYKGHYFLNLKSTQKPGVVDAARQEVFTDDDVYSGCLIRASVSAFAYDKSGNRGVSFGLNNIQVLRKGPRLDGRKAASEEFSEWTDPEVAGGATGTDPLL